MRPSELWIDNNLCRNPGTWTPDFHVKRLSRVGLKRGAHFRCRKADYWCAICGTQIVQYSKNNVRGEAIAVC